MSDNLVVNDRPRILLTQPLAGPAGAWLSQRARVSITPADDPAFSTTLAASDGLVVRTDCRVNDAMLARAPRLKVVGRAGVGLDHIDLGACARRNICVVHTPDANTQAVAEYVIALLLDALRPRTAITGAMTRDAWRTVRDTHTAEREIGSLTVGVLGMGRIGRRVTALLHAFGAVVRYYDVLEIPPNMRCGAAPASLHALFAESDVITLHIDGRSENDRFVGAELLDRMRDDALLINTSRGRVVDHSALADALHASPSRRAILDVHDPEPIPETHPLLHHPRVRLLPHLASRTRSGNEAMEWVVRDVIAVLEKALPQYPASRVNE